MGKYLYHRVEILKAAANYGEYWGEEVPAGSTGTVVWEDSFTVTVEIDERYKFDVTMRHDEVKLLD